MAEGEEAISGGEFLRLGVPTQQGAVWGQGDLLQLPDADVGVEADLADAPVGDDPEAVEEVDAALGDVLPVGGIAPQGAECPVRDEGLAVIAGDGLGEEGGVVGEFENG